MCGGENGPRMWVTRGVRGVLSSVSGIVCFLAYENFVVLEGRWYKGRSVCCGCWIKALP